MPKYKMITLTAESTSYHAPSGRAYVINKGEPFVVTNKADIEFFDKKKQTI